MLSRPVSIVEEVVAEARAPVPTSGAAGSKEAPKEGKVYIGGLPPPETKEEAMVRFMYDMVELQKQQKLAMWRVAYAVAKLDKSKELLSFGMARQDVDLLTQDIKKLEALADAYRELDK